MTTNEEDNTKDNKLRNNEDNSNSPLPKDDHDNEEGVFFVPNRNAWGKMIDFENKNLNRN